MGVSSLPITTWPGGPAPARPPVVVTECIGCGRIDRSRECTGDCADERRRLVRRADHDRACAALTAAEAFHAVAADLAAADPASEGEAEAVYRVLQDRARSALHAVDRELTEEPAAAERLEVWLCTSCGRIEAPRPCLGVCIHEPVEMVEDSVHTAVEARLRAAQPALLEQSRAMRGLASVTPRPGRWLETLRALQRS